MNELNNLFFGDSVRSLRQKEDLPLRKLAANLDIDPSTLGKIERNQRKPTKEIISKLTKIFKLNSNELLIKFISDKYAFEIADKDYSLEILKATRKKIAYLNKMKRTKQ
ncbi:MAG: helix-turn-helix transcriptional regulator [Bacteroidales bacterium]|nr:helix-turn-helix transcriptional regulator [Bacteroidales bacterium]